MMNAYEFAGYMFDYLDVLGSTSNPYSRNPDDPSRPYTVEDYARVEGVDWQDNVYRTALMQQYNVSLSGGSRLPETATTSVSRRWIRTASSSTPTSSVIRARSIFRRT